MHRSNVIQGYFPQGVRGGVTQLAANRAPIPTTGGMPLPPVVRQKMEAFFKTTFNDVRVHVGPHVASLGATAFTHGSNLHFAPGHYDPHSHRGQQVLGTQLTHVVQQRSGRVLNPFGNTLAIVNNHVMEQEARHLGERAAAFMPHAQAIQRTTGRVVQRRKLHDSFLEDDMLAVYGANQNAITTAQPNQRFSLIRNYVINKWITDFGCPNNLNGNARIQRLIQDSAIDQHDVTAMDTLVQRFVTSLSANAAQLLQQAQNDASNVTITQNGIHVYLDNDQLKHQPNGYPIGTRVTHGGNKFKPAFATAQWHQQNTLVHMANWAAGLPRMFEGEKMNHGQMVAVNNIHYEGYCLLSGGTKYVFFHCYPANGSNYKQ